MDVGAASGVQAHGGAAHSRSCVRFCGHPSPVVTSGSTREGSAPGRDPEWGPGAAGWRCAEGAGVCLGPPPRACPQQWVFRDGAGRTLSHIIQAVLS